MKDILKQTPHGTATPVFLHLFPAQMTLRLALGWPGSLEGSLSCNMLGQRGQMSSEWDHYTSIPT